MFNKHWLSNSKKALTLAALGLALVSCGQQESTVFTPWGNTGGQGTCPSGTAFYPGYGCVFNGSTGSSLTADLCTSRQMSSTQQELACYVYLAPTSSSSLNWVGPEVRVGDQVTLMGSLRVGSSYLGSLFGDCKDERDASPFINGAVGSTSFSLPIQSPAVMSTQGTLRFGVQDYSCYESSGLYVRILRSL